MAPAGALRNCNCLLFLVLLAAGRANSAAAAAADKSKGPGPKQQRQLQQLVQSTCNSTTYYDVCVAALAGAAAGDPAASSSTGGLCAIAVSAAAANASASAASVLATAVAYQTQAPERAALLRACGARYADAREALVSAKEAVKEEAYDDAFVHVSAAAEYPTMCRALFRPRTNISHADAAATAYPSELGRREEDLRRLCTVVLDIISLLLITTVP